MAKSPFPGVDPFITQRWEDFHSSFLTYLRDALNPSLGADLRARLQSRVYVEEIDEALTRRAYLPDVHVFQVGPPGASSSATAVLDAPAVAEPERIRVPELEHREPYVDIVDAGTGGQVITTIELVSPTNRTSRVGRAEYRRKQRDCVRGGVSLVEIDLLRIGKPVTLSTPELRPDRGAAPYHVCVHKAWRKAVLDFFAIGLRQRLPVIPIPLRKADAAVPVDLQRAFDEAYERGRYDDIDYRGRIVPAMSDDDAAWVASRTAGPG